MVSNIIAGIRNIKSSTSKWCLLLFFALAVTNVAAEATPCRVTDDTGNTVSLATPAKRIVSLAPNITELLFAAGAGNAVVGVEKHSDYPLAARAIPYVADYNHLDVEKIMALHPDLIVAWDNGNARLQLARLEQLKVPVYFVAQKHIFDISVTLHKFGLLAGTQKTADKAAQNFVRKYAQLEQQYSKRRPIRVFFQLWHAPLITINSNGLIAEVLTLCGGKNIFGAIRNNATSINLESVLSANPDVIIGDSADRGWQAFWAAWPELNAVRRHNLIAINPDIIQRGSPRILLGADILCRDLERARDR